MSASTDWQLDAQRLMLSGELTAQTLLPLWQQKETLLNQITSIDVSALTRVDSAGLALILQFVGDANKRRVSLKVAGVTDKLATLITLYNLKEMMGDSLLP